MKCEVLRTCFRGGQLYKEGQVKEVPDEVALKRTKDFRPLEPLPEASKLVCTVCSRECKSEFGLKVHMRVHNK